MAKSKSKKQREEGGRAEGDPASAEAPPPRPVVVPPPRKVEPKLRTDAALLPDPTEKVLGTLETLKDNWQVIAAGGLVLLVATLFLSWWLKANRDRSALAWQELTSATTGEKPATRERLEELRNFYRGTTAEPFILLKIGDAYFAEGKKEGLKRAIETDQAVLDAFGSNEVAATLAKGTIDAAKRALTLDPAKAAAEKGDKVEWAKGEGPGAPPSR